MDVSSDLAKFGMKASAVVLCLALVFVLATVDAKKKDKGASYDDEYAVPEYLEDPHPKYFSYYIPSECEIRRNQSLKDFFGASHHKIIL